MKDLSKIEICCSGGMLCECRSFAYNGGKWDSVKGPGEELWELIGLLPSGGPVDACKQFCCRWEKKSPGTQWRYKAYQEDPGVGGNCPILLVPISQPVEVQVDQTSWPK